MADFSLTVAIERPPDEVFAFVAEPTTMTEWYDAIDYVTVSPGQHIGLGVRFEIIRSLPGGPVTNKVEITEYEPSSRVTVESRHGPTPFRYRYTLEPRASGTLLRLDGRISGDGLTGPTARLGPIAPLFFERGMKHNLAVLKAVVEAQPSTHSHAEAPPPTHISKWVSPDSTRDATFE